jgi:hypothetical protein
MPCDARGRAYRKYYDDIYIFESNLQAVTNEGNVTTHGIQVFDYVKVDGFFFGDAGLVTNVPSNPGVPTLQTVTGYGASTSDKVSFSHVYADGNVVVNGNMTCSELNGNGEFLDGVANVYELSVLDSKITATESNIIITNTDSLTDTVKGDLLVSTSDGVLDKLTIGSTDQVLFANIASKQLEWVDIDFPDLTGEIDRLESMEQNVMFTNTNTISSLATGDILYAEDTNKLVNLERETRADNTHLTTGDYGTGFGRLLRVDEWGENVMWLHPSNYSETPGNAPIFTTGTSGSLDYITVELRTDKIMTAVSGRIPIASGAAPSNLLFSFRFNDSMFYSEDGRSYSGTGSTKHPSGIKWKLYTYGDIYGSLNGDGGFMVFPQFPSIPFGGTLNPSGAPFLGKAGYLLVFSDKRLKTQISKMTHALDTLSRLVPKLYEKGGKHESGFIAQEMYYDVPEMRHIVWPDRDANPNEHTPEPNYSDWGKRPACLRYLHFIAYVVKSIQELRERIERLKNNKK